MSDTKEEQNMSVTVDRAPVAELNSAPQRRTAVAP